MSLYLDNTKKNSPIVFQMIQNMISKNKFLHSYLFFASTNRNIKNEPYFLIQELIKKYTNQELENIFNFPDLYSIKPTNLMIKKNDILSIINKLQSTSLNNFGLKILYIENIEYANLNACTSLLKFLEEPTKNTYIIMTSNNIFNVLSTVKSRSLLIHLNEYSLEKIAEDIEEIGIDYKYSYLLALMFANVSQAKEFYESEKFINIYTKLVEGLRRGLEENFSYLIIALSQLINSENYWYIAQMLIIFFNDIWRYNKNFSIAFKSHEKLIDGYKKINFHKALNAINNFMLFKERHFNFELSKTNLLISLENCHENFIHN